MPHAFPILECHIWCHTDRHEQRKRVTHSQYLVPGIYFDQDLGMWCWWRKRVPTDRRFSQRSITRLLMKKKNICLFIFFSENVSHKYWKIWLRRANIMPYLTLKLTPYWNWIIIRQLREINIFFAQKYQMSMPISGDRSWLLAHVLWVLWVPPLCQARDKRFFLFFRRNVWIS